MKKTSPHPGSLREEGRRGQNSRDCRGEVVKFMTQSLGACRALYRRAVFIVTAEVGDG